MNIKEIYTRAYDRLNRCTPLSIDCGKLCNSACCQGTDENGMWLFPGEEELMVGETAFSIRPTGRNLPGGRPLFWMVCRGTCLRKLRPLSCRIFPLTPYLNDKGFIMVDADPRAKHICPLTKGKGLMQHEFVRNVARVCRELAKEPDVMAYYKILTEEIRAFQEMERLFRSEA